VAAHNLSSLDFHETLASRLQNSFSRLIASSNQRFAALASRCYRRLYQSLTQVGVSHVLSKAGLLTTTAVLSLFLANPSFAVPVEQYQRYMGTELSGALSGELTSAGNPYIVVDSAWVPEGSTLTLLQGVEINFNEGQGLYMFGILNSIGTRDLHVKLAVTEGAGHWQGLRFFGEHQTRFDWTDLVCPDTAIFLDDGYTVIMNDCRVEAETKAIRPNGWEGNNTSWTLEFTNCFISGGMFLTTWGGTITADHTGFDFGHGQPSEMTGFHGYGTSYSFIHCGVTGGLRMFGGISYAEDCVFRKAGIPGEIMGVNISEGGMKRCYVEGDCGVGSDGQDPIPCEDNTVVGDFYASPRIADIRNCNFQGRVEIGPGDSVRFSNCNIGLTVESMFMDYVRFDSCLIGYNGHGGERVNANGGTIVVTRSVVRAMPYVSGDGDQTRLTFDHNTFVLVKSDETIYNLAGLTLTNNILLRTTEPGGIFIDYVPWREHPNFQYNCFWGFDSFSDAPDSVGYLPDSTNIWVDPALEWFSFVPRLSQNSPCIDRGDPNAPRDPDGSRNDIGALSLYRFNSIIDDPMGQNPLWLSKADAYPNPFNQTLSVQFSSIGSAPNFATLVDANGRFITSREISVQTGGAGLISFDAAGLSTGRYFVVLKNRSFSKVIPVNCQK